MCSKYYSDDVHMVLRTSSLFARGEREDAKCEKHDSFAFIPHKRDMYTRPMRVLSRHDGHQALAHGKSAEQEDLYRPYSGSYVHFSAVRAAHAGGVSLLFFSMNNRS